MSTLSETIIQFFALEKAVHSAFGYVEDWCKIPLEDLTDNWWWMTEDEILWTDHQVATPTEAKEDRVYSAEIYRQRFLPRWVYPAETHTLVCLDTHCDGNKCLGVFDNSKWTGTEPLAEAYSKQKTRAHFEKEG